MYQDREAYDTLYRMARWSARNGIKLGGVLAKKLLAEKIEKIPNTEKNKEGKKVLKELVNSKDEIAQVTLNKSQLGAFKEKARELGLTFASVGSKDSDKVKILFKAKEEEKVLEAIDKMEEVANIADAIEEKKVYDLMASLDFKEVGENLYRQQEVMTSDQIVSMKEELERKGIKSDVVIVEVVDNNKYRVDFKIEHKDKKQIKKPLDELIDGVLHQKKNNPEIGRVIEETKNNPYSFYEEPERKERFEKMVKSKEDLITISVHQKNVLEFEREANKNGIATVPIEKDDGKYTKMLIKKSKEKEAKKILNKIKERGVMER